MESSKMESSLLIDDKIKFVEKVDYIKVNRFFQSWLKVFKKYQPDIIPKLEDGIKKEFITVFSVIDDLEWKGTTLAQVFQKETTCLLVMNINIPTSGVIFPNEMQPCGIGERNWTKIDYEDAKEKLPDVHVFLEEILNAEVKNGFSHLSAFEKNTSEIVDQRIIYSYVFNATYDILDVSAYIKNNNGDDLLFIKISFYRGCPD